MPTYVAGDVRSIQDYIFGSPRLLEMRGASALIDFFDRVAVPELVTKHGGRKVYSGGGNFLASFADEARATELVAAVRNAFLELTGGDGITLISWTPEKSTDFDPKELAQRLRRAKRSPEGARQLASMPFLKRCEVCGRETADETVPVPGTEGADRPQQWIGLACARKHRMHGKVQEARKRKPGAGPWQEVFGLSKPLEVPVVTERLRGAELPANFQELAGEDDLALVVADGNGLGDFFEGKDLDSVEELSARVEKTLRDALDEATEAAFPGEESPNLQVLICGGDDLVVALPARRGLRFAKRLLETFTVTDSGRTAGMAAGLLISKPSFPFRQGHDLADSLLGRAKARCKKGVLSALDFHRVTATQVQSLDQERAAIQREGEAGAWSYGAAGPYTPEELESVLNLAGRLRSVTASQRGRLREILSPRDDGPETPLHEEWKVPARVVAELESWLLRQEGPPPFALDPLALVQDVEGGATSPVYRGLLLADALLLAELGED